MSPSPGRSEQGSHRSAKHAGDPRSAATVVLLHASASSARQWDALGPALAMHLDVHAIDLHGHGMRVPWRGSAPATLADESALVKPLLERGGRAVHLVGHSYGGAVALEIARRHPGRVRSVVVFEPVLFRLLFADAASRAEAQAVTALAESLHERVAAGDDTAAAERFVDFWSGPGAWARMPSPRQAVVSQRMRSVALHFDAAFAGADPRAALGDTPLLCLAGAQTVAPARSVARLLRAALPRAEHATLPAMGHMGPLTHAAAVNTRITDFLLRQVEPPRPEAAFSPAPETTIA